MLQQQAVTVKHPLMSDYEVGYKAYWLGKSDKSCGNQEQVRGWYTACSEDDRGRDAYLNAMQAEGNTDWAGMDSVITYNAFGDIVR